MDSIAEALRLLKRQAEIERQRRQPGGITIIEERELFAIRYRLEDFPAGVRAIAELSGARHQSLDQIRIEDLER